MESARRWTGCGAMAVALVALVACIGAGVVVNEVSWSGTAASSSDEWIELYNPTDAPVDLTGWVVAFGDTVIHLDVAEDATVEVRRTSIDPDGYYVLERTDDDTVSDLDADLLYTGTLANGGVPIELRDAAGVVVDRVTLIESGWPAGTASSGEPSYASMERVGSVGNAESTEWRSNDGTIRNGLDKDGNAINGTPGRENSAVIIARTVPRIDLVAPMSEGEVLSGTVIVQWVATDPDGAPSALHITIECSIDAGETWLVLASTLANGGSYAWDTTRQSNSDTAALRVLVEDSHGHKAFATSPEITIRN